MTTLQISTIVLLLSLSSNGSAASSADANSLFERFENPPREYSVRPFWFWNGRLDANEIDRQIREMVSQGVYGAYVHNRTGLQTPYLSEAYFDAVKAGLRTARELNFHLTFVDEYEWPSGEARDVWLKGLPSRVLASDPSLRMRSLDYEERRVDGPSHVVIEGVRDLQFAVAARLTRSSEVAPDTLTVLPADAARGSVSWQAPAGKWIVLAFHLIPARGVDGGMVDLMNPASTRKFLELVHQEYFRRFSHYFGNVIDSFFSDHEGAYGYRIAWTPSLFDVFRESKGYDLRKFLPLLILDGGKITPKIRCDYLDVVAELYARGFFQQVAGWSAAHRTAITGHTWEESLRADAALDGDYFRQMTRWSFPGVDTLGERWRSPRDFKAAASVAHFRGTRFSCENQGLQGSDSYLDLQKMRTGTNMIANWGANLLVPHAFNYNRTRIEYPPDWFYHEPYWKYFRHYADYARRVSFMNDSGAHVAPILVFYPTETGWANSAPIFQHSDPRALRTGDWRNALDEIDPAYTKLLEGLAQNQWDYDVANSDYLLKAQLGRGHLTIGPESFQAVILPPATTVRRSVARKLREYFESGGTVIALGRLATESMEDGRDDPELAAEWKRIFGPLGQGTARNESASGGKAYFIATDSADLYAVLQATLRRDVRVVSGDASQFYYQHRRTGNLHFYWLVNDSGNTRDLTAVLSAPGIPEKWDAASGARSPLPYRPASDGVAVQLHFAPWDAYYVVLGNPVAPDPECQTETDAPVAPLVLAGNWSFRLEKSSVFAPYAKVQRAAGDEGSTEGWSKKEFRDSSWTRQWLSRERLTIRKWWIVGPFPNQDHSGFFTAYEPEHGIDLKASYHPGGETLRWKEAAADSYSLNLYQQLGLRPGTPWLTAYAMTWVYSPVAQKVQFLVTADNNAKLWVNGENLLDWHIHPFYYEMREQFTLARDANLKAGYNAVLVKVCRGERGQFAFMVRIAKPDGSAAPGLVATTVKVDGPPPAPENQRGAGFLWYRIDVPPGAGAARLPRFEHPPETYYNGRRISVDRDGVARWLPPAAGVGNVLAIRAAETEDFPDSPVFLTAKTTMPLGSWIDLGVPYYSGSAVYETDFEPPQSYRGRKLVLDLGQVGVAAEVSVNGQPAGVRVWLPFEFDITRLAHTGRNHLAVMVTNTMENERAVENHRSKLEKLKNSGLIGPVRIVARTVEKHSCRLP